MKKSTKIRIVYNQKGGVGKTTLAVNFATASALSGHRTLLVDSDPQANSTHYLLGEESSTQNDTNEKKPLFQKSLVSFYESCLGMSLFRQSIFDHLECFESLAKISPLLHLLPCTRELEDLRSKLETKHKIHKLRDGLRNGGFSRVYLDPPPAADFFAYSCLVAADEVIVPIDCDSFSILAAKELSEMVREIKNDHNPKLEILGIVVNQFQKNTKHALKLVKELQTIGLPILEPHLPGSVKVRESHSEHTPFVLSKSTFSDLFLKLVEEVELKSEALETSHARNSNTEIKEIGASSSNINIKNNNIKTKEKESHL